MKSLILALVFCVCALGSKFDEKAVQNFGNDIDRNGLQWLAPKVDETIASIITRATDSLRDQGYSDDADNIQHTYNTFYTGFVTAEYSSRHQGDHEAFIKFLTNVWDVVFDKVCGNDWAIAKALHLSDLYSVNYSLIPVFKMCTFDLNGMQVDREAEVRRHFAKDDDERALYGLVPIVTYWGVEAGCLAGTNGAGSMLCGIAASLSEKLMGDVIAPCLSDKIFTKSCKQ